MKLFPAIDILDNRCVRLFRGDFRQVTVYGDPVQMAVKWAEQGADYLHVVDLNGARDGSEVNAGTIRAICEAVPVPVQVGGGIRSEKTVDARLDAGAARVILGTACCESPRLVETFVRRFGADRIVCGIDCKDGFAAVRGWTETSSLTGTELGRAMFANGVRTVVFTDISRDGALTGVNVAACRRMAEDTGLAVIASGGVRSVDDLRALKEAGIYGAILGKALYEGNFGVKQAKEAVL